MKVTIQREEWAFGNDGGELFDGKKLCALGFVGLAKGIPSAEMLDQFSLGALFDDPVLRKWEPLIAEINDNPNLETWERESKLAEAFEEVAIDVVFVGSYPS